MKESRKSEFAKGIIRKLERGQRVLPWVMWAVKDQLVKVMTTAHIDVQQEVCFGLQVCTEAIEGTTNNLQFIINKTIKS